MKYIFTICYIICLFHPALFSQGWIHSYDPTPFEEYHPVVIQTPDGGFVSAGVTQLKPFSSENLNVVVIKTDASGQEQWSRMLDYNYGVAYGRQTQAFALMRGQTLIIGADSETGYCYNRPVFWEMDLEGNILDLHPIEEDFKMERVIQLEDGRLALHGTSPHISWPNCYNQNALIILDTNFQITYFSFPPPFSGLPNYPLSLLELENGNILGFGEYDFSGYYALELYHKDGYFEKIPVTVGGEYDYEDKELIPGRPGFFYLAADGLLQKRRQSDFSIVWSRHLQDFNGDNEIIPTDDDGFFVASAWGDSIFCERLDSSGYTIWQTSIPVFHPQTTIQVGLVHSILHSVQQTSDKGFILSGSHLPSPDTLLSMFLLKIDKHGSFGATLQGKVIVDDNANCTNDLNEAGSKRWIVEAKNQLRSYYGTTNASGDYLIQLDTGSYMVSVSYPGSGYFDICNNHEIVVLPDATDTITHNVIVTPKVSCPLLKVSSARNFIRPCVENKYAIQYCNYGSAVSSNTEIAVIMSDYMSFASSVHAHEISGDTIFFSVGDLLPGNCRTIYLDILIDCLAPLDSLFCLEIIASPNDICDPSLAGYTGYREKRCLSAIIPFDPNDKTADPEGEGPTRLVSTDTTINYKIRFQNTGNDTAFNVVILDTLPAQLDISTFVPGASSHDYEWEIFDNRVLSFTFKNIMLPDSHVNAEASHGFVVYDIQIGKEEIPRIRFDNHAAIYFDYNGPILTEPAFHTIKAPVIRDSLYTTVCCNEDFSNCDFHSDTTLIHYASYPLYDQITSEFITVSQIAETEDQKSFCTGEVIYYGDQTYADPGVYLHHFTGASGCDSIVKLTLTQLPLHSASASYEICEGDTLDGIIFTDAGEYAQLDTLEGVESCDTVVIKYVLVHPVEIISEHVQVQSGEIYQGLEITHDTVLVNIDTTLHGCKKITNVFVQVLTTSIHETGTEIKFTIKPNPFKSQLVIETGAENFSFKNIKVLDFTGRLVPSTFYTNLASGKSEVTLELPGSPPGLYMVCIETPNGISCQKVLKN